MKVVNHKNISKHSLVIESIFNMDFIVSAIIPIIIFSIFSELKMTLDGIILSAVWSIGMVLVSFVKENKINALAAIAGIFSFIGLIGTIISRNPTFYLISPMVQEILCGIIFLSSLFFKRTLIQIIAEQSYMRKVSEEIRKKPKYKKVWRILTAEWAILYISQAVLRVILLYSVSMETYYTIGTLYDSISSILLLIFTISFAKRYLKEE